MKNSSFAREPSPLRRPGGLFFRVAGPLLALSLMVLPLTVRALPSFARQMNMQCIACHTEYPLLNEFGRQFKLTGYTLSTEQSEIPVLAAMLMPSFTHTAQGQAGGAAPGFGDNNNTALTQASLFYAGRLFGPYASKMFGADAARFANKFGIFMQLTYNGVGKNWTIDNTELRYADRGTWAGHDVAYGMYLNNNPTLQDPWNTVPAWGFPFTGSGLAPRPGAGILINGATAQQVGGAGAYAMVDNKFYVDVAGYRTLGARFQKSVGVNPDGETQISGLAPYWRLAWVKSLGNASWQVGTFGIAADTYPGRDQSAGHDRIVDVGFDSQYQTSFGHHDLTGLFSWIHERQNWHASEALGATGNSTDSLWNAKVTVDYLYDKTFGFSAQYFAIDGSRDDVLYAGSATGSPRSDGVVLQANYLPFNKMGGPAFWPRSNVKLSLQYTAYNHFDGAATDYDGAGTNARDNNTLYLEAWIVF